MGRITADAEGGYTFILVLPERLAEGKYTVTATAAEHQITSPPFTVSGVAISAEEGVQRGQEDALLAPMPSSAPGIGPMPLPTPGSSAQPSSTQPSLALIAIALTAVGAVLAAAWVRLRRC